jgi:hypothetical protein
MSFGLLRPLGLAALAALVIPIAIHLIRRTESAPVVFPAMRWLSASARPRRRLRLEDLLLLLTRIALIAALALLLAEPFILNSSRGARHWVLLSTELERDEIQNLAFDVSAEPVWIAPGFPPIEDTRPPARQPLASLLREFDAQSDAKDRMTVVVPQRVSGLDGEVIQLRREIDWRVIARDARAEETIGVSGLRSIALRYAEGDPALPFLRAAINAWSVDRESTLDVEEQLLDAPIGGDTSLLVRTGSDFSEDVRRWIENGGTALVSESLGADGVAVWRRASGEVLARLHVFGRGRVLSLEQDLDPDVFPELLDASFPKSLLERLTPRASGVDQAYAEAVKPVGGEHRSMTRRDSLTAELGIAIALLSLLERLLATRRRGGR